jgi:hypothetical protein
MKNTCRNSANGSILKTQTPPAKNSNHGHTNGGSSRRAFVKRVLAATAVANASGLTFVSGQGEAKAAVLGPVNGPVRRAQAYQVRLAAARVAFERGVVGHPTNGDEELYHNQIGSFTKALAHNALGEVDLNAYGALLKALASGRQEDFNAIPLDLGAKLTNPQSGLAFDLEGPDSHSLTMPPAPARARADPAGAQDEG